MSPTSHKERDNVNDTRRQRVGDIDTVRAAHTEQMAERTRDPRGNSNTATSKILVRIHASRDVYRLCDSEINRALSSGLRSESRPKLCRVWALGAGGPMMMS